MKCFYEPIFFSFDDISSLSLSLLYNLDKLLYVIKFTQKKILVKKSFSKKKTEERRGKVCVFLRHSTSIFHQNFCFHHKNFQFF